MGQKIRHYTLFTAVITDAGGDELWNWIDKVFAVMSHVKWLNQTIHTISHSLHFAAENNTLSTPLLYLKIFGRYGGMN